MCDAYETRYDPGRTTMIGNDRQAAGAGQTDKRSEARLQLHSMLQWLARLANSYVEADAAGRHLTVLWDGDRHAFLTREFDGGFAVELRLPSLEMQFREHGVLSPHVLDVEGRSPAEVEAWMLVELLHRGVNRSRFSKQLPYGPARLMHGDARQFSPGGLADELADLATWLDMAAGVLTRLAGRLRASGQSVDGEIRCWPEQLHLAVTVALEPGSTSEALRVGLSAGDDKTSEPHFLVVAERTRSASTMLPNSVLPASRIAASGMSSDDIVAFLEQQIDASRRKLAH
jgi:hypothetical protein